MMKTTADDMELLFDRSSISETEYYAELGRLIVKSVILPQLMGCSLKILMLHYYHPRNDQGLFLKRFVSYCSEGVMDETMQNMVNNMILKMRQNDKGS